MGFDDRKLDNRSNGFIGDAGLGQQCWRRGGICRNGRCGDAGTGINAAGLTFGTTGYTLSGNTLSLSGGATVDVEASLSVTISSLLAGSAGLEKTGGGTLTLSGNNSFSGGATLTSGTVIVTHNNALGADTVTLNGGKLQAGSSHRTLSNAVVAATGTTSELIAPSNSNLTLAGNLSGDGAIWKTGAFSVFLGGNNSSFAGVFSNRQSNLFFNSADSGSAAAAWDNTGGNQFAMNFATNGTIRFGAFGGASGMLHGGYNLAGAKTVEIGALDLSTTFSGAVKDFDAGNGGSTLAVVKRGSGVLTLSGSNSYSAGTTIAAGVLVAAHNAALGTGAVTLSGGNLQSGNGHRSLANAIIASASTVSGLVSPANNNLTLTGDISGAGTLWKLGAFSVFLAGDNSGFSGAFSHRQSNLYFNSATAGSAAAAWDISGGNQFAANFNGDATLSFGSLAATTGQIAGGGTGTKTFAIGALNTSTSIAAPLMDAISGSGPVFSLLKSGTGTLTLNGANVYSGNTTVDAGALTLTRIVTNGQSTAGKGTVTINDGATLLAAGNNVFGAGTGMPVKIVVSAGGTLATGNLAHSELPAVEMSGGTIASGTPHPYWGSFALSEGIATIGGTTSVISAKNAFIPDTQEINTAAGSRLEIAGDFNGSAAYGKSKEVVAGAGTVAKTATKKEYRISNPQFQLGETAAPYHSESVVLAEDDWIAATSVVEAVQKAVNVSFYANGQLYSFGPSGTNGQFSVATVGMLKQNPNYTAPSGLSDDAWIIAFEDYTDGDLDDAYVTFALEEQDQSSEDPGNDCDCDCDCSPADTMPDGAGSTSADSLQQQSTTVNPRPIIRVRTQIEPDQSPPDLIEVQLEFNGVAQPTVFLDPTGFSSGDRFLAAAQADASALATGRYAWEMKVVSHYGSSKLEDNFSGFQDVVNRTASEFGAGWSLAELDRLNIETEGVNLITGANQAIWFQKDGGDYVRQAGDAFIQSMVRNGDNSFTLTYNNGARSEFNSAGLLTSRIQTNGNTRTYTYSDVDGDSVADELVSVLDERGETTTYGYTGGHLASVTDHAGQVTTYAYNMAGQLETMTQPDPDGAGPQAAPVWTYGYDATTGLLSSITDPRNLESKIFYDHAGRVSSIEQACGGTSTQDSYFSRGVVDLSAVGYDASHPAPLTSASDSVEYREDELGNPTLIERDHRGYVTKETDALGNVTTYRRDVNGRITKMTQADPDGAGPLSERITTYSYDANGNLLSRTNPDSSTEIWSYESTFNKVTSYTDPLGRVTLYEIDPLTGDMLSETRIVGLNDQVSSETDDVTTSYAYTDGSGGIPAGLVSSITDPLGRVTEMVYNNAGLLISQTDAVGTADEATTEYEYDARDNLSAVIDPLGRRTEYVYDNLNRLIQRTDPDPDGIGPLASPVWTYQYDAVGNQTHVTDPLGSVTEYVYDERNRIEQVIEADPDGAGMLTSPVTSYVYDCVGNLTSITDPLGRVTTYTYDELNRLTSTTLPDPDGVGPLTSPVSSQAYDNAGNLATRTDALGNVTIYRYDIMGRLLETTLPDPDGAGPQASPITSQTYNLAGQVVATTDALGRVTEYEYDDLGRQVKTILPDPDGIGSQTSPEYVTAYDKSGNVTSRTDALGNITSYAYDNLNRLIETTLPDPDGAGPESSPVYSSTYDVAGQLVSSTDALGRVTTYSYDKLGRQTSITQPDPDGVGPLAAPVASFTYDAVDNLLATTDPLGNVTTFSYDALHRRVSMTEADPDGVGSLTSPVTTWAFDAASQMVSATDPLGRTTGYTYDGLGRQISVMTPDPDGAGPLSSSITHYSHDAVGNLVELTDPLGNVTTRTYDHLYRLIQEELPDPDGAGPLARPTTVYAYDSVGNRLSLTDPVGNTTTWTYDGLDRVLTDTNELNKSRSFVYDPVGNLVERTDRNGRVTEYAHDSLYRKIEENWLDGSSAVIRTLSFSYDAIGQLLSASDPSATYSYTYDDLDRVIEEGQTIAGFTPIVTLQRTYDAYGNRTSLSATLDSTLDYHNAYTFDALHRATQITQAGQLGGNAMAEKRFDLHYNAAGQWTSFDRFADLAGSEYVATTSYAYDGIGRLTGLQHTQGVTSLAGYAYTYDAASRITAINSVLDGLTDYTNDATGQLIDTDHNGQPDESYSYDENGNRITNTVGANNRILSDGTYDYEYDDEGNMTAKETISTGERVEYVWDHRNRLVSVISKDGLGAVVKQVDQSYDYANRWVRRSVDPDGAGVASAANTFFTYEGDQITLQFEGNSASDLSHRYLWGEAVDQIFADEQVSSLGSAGSVLYPLTDHLNTTRDLAEYDSGADTTSIVNHRRFDSFGNVISETNSSVDSLFGFTARPFDDSTELQWNLNRWYVSHLGVWMSEDPIGFEAGDANVRRYAGNAPATNIDPSGLIYISRRPVIKGGLKDLASTVAVVGKGQCPGGREGTQLAGSVTGSYDISITAGGKWTTLFAKAITIGSIGLVDIEASAEWSATVTLEGKFNVNVDYVTGCIFPTQSTFSTRIKGTATAEGIAEARLRVADRGYRARAEIIGEVSATFIVTYSSSSNRVSYRLEKLDNTRVQAVAYVDKFVGGEYETIWQKKLI